MYLGNDSLTNMISGAAASLPRHSHSFNRHNDYYRFSNDGRSPLTGEYNTYSVELVIPMKDSNGNPVNDPNNNPVTSSTTLYIHEYLDDSTDYTGEIGG